MLIAVRILCDSLGVFHPVELGFKGGVIKKGMRLQHLEKGLLAMSMLLIEERYLGFCYVM